jgi:hypothetical protein
LENPGLQAFIFRRSLPELDGNHIQPMKKEMPVELGSFNETKKRYEFYNGSTIQFQYLERDSDCDRIQGKKYILRWLMRLGSSHRISWATLKAVCV